MLQSDQLGPNMGTFFIRYSREFVITEFDCILNRPLKCLILHMIPKDYIVCGNLSIKR